MLPSKQKATRRSITDPLPRALPIDPLHRDSLAYPLLAGKNQSRTPVPSVMSGAMGPFGQQLKPSMPLRPNTLPLPPLREAAPSADGAIEEHYSEWMTPYCGDPFTDIDNTCTGLWATCALYGKTHWRLQQIVAKKSPQDDAWNSRAGFNAACWAQWGSSFFLMEPLGGVLVGIQRSQIRGTYGIDGHIAQDMMLGVCMTKCTQMQNDREVRAREGKIDLRKSKGYKDFRKASKGTVNQQPQPKPPMRYSPGESNPAEARLYHSESTLKKRSNSGEPSSTKTNANRARSGKERSTLGELYSKRSFRVLRNNGKQEDIIRSSRSNIPKGEYDGANSILLAAYPQDDRFPDSSKVKGRKLSVHTKNHPSSNLAGVPEEQSLVRHPPSSSEVSTRRSSQLSANLNGALHSQLSHDGNTFTFALPDCDMIIGTSNGIMVRHSPRELHKTSPFTHGSTGFPIDKSFLGHSGTEEHIVYRNYAESVRDASTTDSNQQQPRQHITSGSGIGSCGNNLEDCRLERSSQGTLQPPSSNCTPVTSLPDMTNPQDSLGVLVSVKMSPDVTTPQHAVQRGRSLATLPNVARKQSLDGCTPVSSATNAISGRRSIEDCVSTKSLSGTVPLSDDCSDCSDCALTISCKDINQFGNEDYGPLVLSNKDFAPRLISGGPSSDKLSTATEDESARGNVGSHTLSNCNLNLASRTASLVQHTLDDCNMDLASRKASTIQHTLENCNSDLETRKDSVVQHTVGNCNTDLTFQDPRITQHTLGDCVEGFSPENHAITEHTLDNCALESASSKVHTVYPVLEEEAMKGKVKHERNTEGSMTKSTGQHLLENCFFDDISPLVDEEERALASFSSLSDLDSANRPQQTLKDHTSERCLLVTKSSRHSDTYLKPRPISGLESSSRRNSSLRSSTSQQAASSDYTQIANMPERRSVSSSSLPTAFDLEAARESHPEPQQNSPESTEESEATRTLDVKLEQKAAALKRGRSSVPSETSATPSLAQQFLTQIWAQNQNKMRKTQLDGVESD